jgi:hypothetical protein
MFELVLARDPMNLMAAKKNISGSTIYICGQIPVVEWNFAL